MVIPFLPIYIQELGVTEEDKISLWSGVIFASTFVTSFIMHPIWGQLSDRVGRKIMVIRSGLGMAIVIILMGFATNVWHLFILRVLYGTVAGFIPASTALASANTPKERAGFAMGTLQSGAVAGTILGPLIGGLLAGWVGFRPIFFVTGFLALVATLLVLFIVKEDFDKKKAAQQPKISILESWKQIREIRHLPALFAVTFMIQFSIIGSMPQIPLFIQQMHVAPEWLAFYAGLVSAITGISNMIASPILGRVGDRIGSQSILAICLLGAAICYIPQAFVMNVWQLLIVRFISGCFIGGLIPSVNALIRQYTPDGMEGRAYSFNSSSFALGNMLGPVFGGLIAGYLGIRPIFIISAILLFINFIWIKKQFTIKRQIMKKAP